MFLILAPCAFVACLYLGMKNAKIIGAFVVIALVAQFFAHL